MRRGENPSLVLEGVHRQVENLNRSILPQGMKLEVFEDRSTLVRESLGTVHENLLHGFVLVVGIVWLFLRSVTGSLAVAVIIPLSLLAAFFGLHAMGLPANLISMGAIDFGILVDGAVVLIENVLHAVRRQRPATRKETLQVIIRTSVEVVRPAFFAMLIIIAALLPVFTLESVEGRIFRPLALTYTFALVGALVFTLTVVPALCALLFKANVRLPDEPRWMERMKARYARLLAGTLTNSAAVVALAAIVLGLSDLAAMRKTLQDAKEVLQGVPCVTELDLYRDAASPQLRVNFDRAALARAGIAIEDAARTLEASLAGRVVTQFWENERPVEVRLTLPSVERSDVDKIGQIALVGAAGARIPLRDLASIDVVDGAAYIVREGNTRLLALKFNVKDRDMGSTVKEAIATVTARIKPPDGHYFIWGGEFENQQRALGRLKLVIPVAILLVLGLLYAAMNSGRGALAVLAIVPFAMTGGVLALLLSGIALSVSAVIGFIALLGQVSLMGVLVLSAIDARRRAGEALPLALAGGAADRLRPVLMTSCLAFFGLLPMVLSSGVGSEIQRPFALVVVGGMVSSRPRRAGGPILRFRQSRERQDRYCSGGPACARGECRAHCRRRQGPHGRTEPVHAHRHALFDPVRHRPVRQDLDREGGAHPDRGDGAGVSRDVPVPAKRALHADSGDRRPNRASGNFRDHARRGIFDQRADHVRHGVGNRHRGRRRHRRRRERRTNHGQRRSSSA